MNTTYSQPHKISPSYQLISSLPISAENVLSLTESFWLSLLTYGNVSVLWFPGGNVGIELT